MTSPTYSGSDVLEFLQEAKNYNQSLIRLISRYFKSGTALDFGAGIGTFTQLLQNQNCRIECVELDDQQRLLLIKTGYQTFKSLDDIQGSYDFIYSLNVLEHIEDDSVVAAALVEKLSSKGVIFIFVPAFQLLYSGFDRRLGHYRRYQKQEVAKLFPDLDIIELRYFDTMGFCAAWVYKLLANNREGRVSLTAIWIFDRIVFPLNKVLDPLFSPWIGKNVLFVARKKI
jgi:hypothetical protein